MRLPTSILTLSLVALLPLRAVAGQRGGFLIPGYSLNPVPAGEALVAIDPESTSNVSFGSTSGEFAVEELQAADGDSPDYLRLPALDSGRDLMLFSWVRSVPFARNAPRLVAPFPVVLSRSVRRFVDLYLSNLESLDETFRRSAPFMPVMARTLESAGVPSDFVYLSFAESDFTGRGAGPWQLSRATAKRFGLRVDRYVDERRDPVKSTQAAAEYLASIHDQVGDWRLAVVGWNRGEQGIDRFMRYKGADYERLANSLPRPTRLLLNRFTAVAFIARNAQSYGIEPAGNTSGAFAYERMSVPGGTSLNAVASLASTSVDKIRRLNPALLRDRVPPDSTHYDVFVPRGSRSGRHDS